MLRFQVQTEWQGYCLVDSAPGVCTWNSNSQQQVSQAKLRASILMQGTSRVGGVVVFAPAIDPTGSERK
jgi:hypothetical protein